MIYPLLPRSLEEKQFSMSKVLQISDTHIVPHGQLAYGQVDTATALDHVVESINRLLPAIGPVDAVIITGDLTDFGQADDYARFKSLMSPLAIPYLAVPGNHDNREVMRDAFVGNMWMPDAGPIDWLLTLEDFTVIGLDSSVAGKAYGLLADESLDFLRDALIKASGRPVLIALHHPPVLTGLHVMDQQNLLNADALAKVVASYEGPLQILCGHVHRATTSLLAGKICQTAPGTSHAVTLDLREAADNSLTKEPGAFMLHEWRNGGFLSHFIPVGQFDGPHPFY